MKKLLSFICILALALTFGSCEDSDLLETADLSDVNVENINYNNYFTSDTSVITDGNEFFFMKYGILNSGLYIYDDGNSIPLVNESSFSDADYNYAFFVSGNYLYYALDSYVENYETTFYRYDLSEKSYEQLPLKSQEVYSWMACGDLIIYLEYYNVDDGFGPLYCYDISSDTTTLIASEIEDFSIVNGKVRYIRYNSGYLVYEYDHDTDETDLLGAFDGYSIKESVTYNFTDNTVITVPMTVNEYNYPSEFTVYHIDENKEVTYSFPGAVWQLVAADKYAFADCEIINDENESEGYAIYKIDLENGEYELLDIESDDYTTINAISDDQLIILRYDGSKTKVIRYNVADGKTEELFSY